VSHRIWIAVLLAAVVAFEVAFFNLAQTGTCASGGPYVIGDECPSGTGGWVALMIVSALLMAASTLGLPPIGADEDSRAWLPAFAFVPGTKESAVFFPLTATVLLAAGTETGTLIAAGVLVLAGPGLWAGMTWLLADTDRVLSERRRKKLREGARHQVGDKPRR
jgi:hypothetical protein